METFESTGSVTTAILITNRLKNKAKRIRKEQRRPNSPWTLIVTPLAETLAIRDRIAKDAKKENRLKRKLLKLGYNPEKIAGETDGSISQRETGNKIPSRTDQTEENPGLKGTNELCSNAGCNRTSE